MNINPNNTNTETNRTEYGMANSQSTVSSAFSDDTSHRLMNSNGQQIPQPYQQYQQANRQPVPPPQYPQYPQANGQPVPLPQYPQYQQVNGQPISPPQYPQYQQANGQYIPPQYLQYQPVNYYYPIITQEYINKQLFKRHCSRVGLTAMADVGLMLAVQIIVIIGGMISFYILKNKGYFSWLDEPSAIINIEMFAMAVSAIVGNLVPAAAHGHKWRIKFTEPFKGDKLSVGFIAAATLTALGLNFIWNFIYNILADVFINFIGEFGSTNLEYEINYPVVAFIIMVIWSCIIAPITEEYMFRGILMRTLSKHGAAFGIVSSAFIFGLMHGNLAQTPMAFLIGLVLGYVATKSGNIRQSIAIHMINNIFATIPSIVMYFCPEMIDIINNVYMIIEIAAMIFAVAAIIYTAVVHKTGKKARLQRIQTASNLISSAENRLIKIEISPEKLKPEFQLVNHKFRNFISSGGMIFFICFMCVLILLSILPYLWGIFLRILDILISM